MTPADAVTKWPKLAKTSAVLVCALAQSNGRVVSHEDILNRMWDMLGEHREFDLRHAVSRARKAGVPIETLHGIGYRLAD